MTRKQRRASLLLGLIVLLGIAGGLVLYALRETITYFKTPSDVIASTTSHQQRFRLGGLVAKGTVKRGQGTEVEFGVTDTLKTITVVYKGVLPDLFREGQGVVAEGKLEGDGRFRADAVLAKHDETYMPPEVAKALRDKGVKLGAGATHPHEAPPATPVMPGK